MSDPPKKEAAPAKEAAGSGEHEEIRTAPANDASAKRTEGGVPISDAQRRRIAAIREWDDVPAGFR